MDNKEEGKYTTRELGKINNKGVISRFAQDSSDQGKEREEDYGGEVHSIHTIGTLSTRLPGISMTDCLSMLGSSSSSPTSVLCLPDDMLSAIFLHLPIELLFQLKTVSKGWRSILASSGFTKQWVKNNYSLVWTIILDRSSSYEEGRNSNSRTRFFTYAFPPVISELMHRHEAGFSLGILNEAVNQIQKTFVLGSCNGLVLTESIYYDEHHLSSSLTRKHFSIPPPQQHYHVCNPLTRKFVLIPPPEIQGFVPTWFLYDDGTDTQSFTVVRIPYFEPSKTFEIEMFSSDLGEWQVCEVSSYEDVRWNLGVYDNLASLNGVCYWLQKNDGKIFAVSTDNKGASCTNSNSYLIDAPGRVADGENGNRTQCMGKSEGIICFARIRLKDRSISVWELCENWKLLHTVSVNSMVSKIRSVLGESSGSDDIIKGMQILEFSPVKRSVVVLGYEKQIWLYDTTTMESEILRHSSFLGGSKRVPHSTALVFKPRPTVIPSLSGKASTK